MDKLNDFYDMTDDLKFETVQSILEGIHDGDHHKLAPLFKTWIQILSKVDSKKITYLFKIYFDVLLMNPTALTNLDIEPFLERYQVLDKRQRERMSDCFIEALFLNQNRQKLIRTIPEAALRLCLSRG
jgi:hypothetical protein